jgi:hypothetical protein
MSALSVGFAENIESAKMDFLQRRTIPNVRDVFFLRRMDGGVLRLVTNL